MASALLKIINHFTKRKMDKGWKKTEREIHLLNQPFESILFEKKLIDAGITTGDLIYFQISLTGSNINFKTIPEIINVLCDLVGPNGGIICPSFTNEGSLIKALSKGKVFNSSKSPVTTGIFNEILRRMPNTTRSDHPINSYIGIGSLAENILKEHSKSIFLYDQHNPVTILNNTNNTKCLSFNIPFCSYHPIHHITSKVVEENQFYLNTFFECYSTKDNLSHKRLIKIPNEFMAYLIDITFLKDNYKFAKEINCPGLPGYVFNMDTISNYLTRPEIKKIIINSHLSKRNIPFANLLGQIFLIKKLFLKNKNVLIPKDVI